MACQELCSACSLSRSGPSKTLSLIIPFLLSQQGPACTGILCMVVIKEHGFVDAASRQFTRKELSTTGPDEAHLKSFCPTGFQIIYQQCESILRYQGANNSLGQINRGKHPEGKWKNKILWIFSSSVMKRIQHWFSGCDKQLPGRYSYQIIQLSMSFSEFSEKSMKCFPFLSV